MCPGLPITLNESREIPSLDKSKNHQQSLRLGALQGDQEKCQKNKQTVLSEVYQQNNRGGFQQQPVEAYKK